MLKINPVLCWRFCRRNLSLVVDQNKGKPLNVVRKYSASVKNKTSTDTIDEGPIKFSTSQARNHRAEDSRKGQLPDRPAYEGEIVILCLASILIYFCVVREENDIDKELDRSLYSRIEGLEELQLKLCLQYNQEHGLDTEAIEKRLEEIRSAKNTTESDVPEQI